MLSDRIPLRLENLRRTLKALDVPALLVSDATNVRYLSGFTGEDAVLVLHGERSILISDGRFTTQIAQECPDVEAHIRPIGQGPTEGIAQVVQGLRISRIGFEPAALSVASYQALREKLATVDFQPLAECVETLRQIKDDDEVRRDSRGNSLRGRCVRSTAQ